MKDEFKFEEDIGDAPTRTKASKKFTNIVSILVALFFGITVFVIVSLLINKNTPKEEAIKQIDIEDNTVQELYKKVSYNELNTKDPIFIQNKSTDSESMSNKDKYLLALSLVDEKEVLDTNTTKEDKKVYSITPDVIREHMKDIFGDGIKYTRDTTIDSYVFSFDKDGLNTASIKYDQTAARYEVIFNSKTEENDTPLNRNYYSELSKAENVEGNLVLTEKIVYVNCIANEEDDDTYSCELYKDYDKTIKLEEKNNISKKGILLDSLKETNIIKYEFENSNNKYILKSTEIES